MSTETATNPLLTEGRGVVIRDTKGVGEPVLGRIVRIADGYTWVRLDGGRVARFELSTLCAMLPGDHERWMLTAPQTQSSEEYDGLRTRQARLEGAIDRLRQELDIVTAVLDTADDAAVEPFPVPGSTEGPESLPELFREVHDLAGQVADRISDGEVEARLRHVLARCGYVPSEQPPVLPVTGEQG